MSDRERIAELEEALSAASLALMNAADLMENDSLFYDAAQAARAAEAATVRVRQRKVD